MKIETINTFVNENLKENSFGRQYIFSDKVHTLKTAICVHEKLFFRGTLKT